MIIGDRLKEIRESTGMSVYKLSQLSGVSSTYIHEIERNQKQPTVEMLSRLCKVMNVGLAYFFSNEVINITIDDLIDELKDLNSHEIAALHSLVRTFKNRR